MTPNESLDILRRPGLARTMLGMLAVGFLLLLVIGVSSVVSARRIQSFSARVEHTVDVRQLNAEALRLVVDAETGQRGYLLTREDRYLRSHDIAIALIGGRLDRLARMVSDNPGQVARVRAIQVATQRRLSILELVLAMAKANRQDEAIDILQTGRGEAEMIKVRQLAAEIDREEAVLLGQREQALQSQVSLNLVINVLALLLIALLAGVSIFVISRYVSELHASRSELDDLNRGLENAIAERTEELRNANDEIQKFAYIVSHDLRAPLVNVMGYTSEMEAAARAFERQMAAVRAKAPELLDAEAVTAIGEDVPEAIGFIRTSTAKMDRLINAILKLSRDGRRTLNTEAVDMTALARAIADSLSHQTGEAGAQIVVEPLPALTTDRLAVDQIFGNLLDNAVKFLDPGRPGRIVVSGRSDGWWNLYQIADNGRGVAQKDHERVFELFRRAGSQDRPGEGLGLAFVRNSVRRLGGSIELASIPGEGSTFTLKFPKATPTPGNEDV